MWLLAMIPPSPLLSSSSSSSASSIVELMEYGGTASTVNKYCRSSHLCYACTLTDPWLVSLYLQYTHSPTYLPTPWPFTINSLVPQAACHMHEQCMMQAADLTQFLGKWNWVLTFSSFLFSLAVPAYQMTQKTACNALSKIAQMITAARRMRKEDRFVAS